MIGEIRTSNVSIARNERPPPNTALMDAPLCWITWQSDDCHHCASGTHTVLLSGRLDLLSLQIFVVIILLAMWVGLC